MALRKHSRFSILSLTIFFLFLNGVCLASPALKYSCVNEQFSLSSFLHTMEIMEESSIQISLSQNTENNLSGRIPAPGRFLKKDGNTAVLRSFGTQQKFPLVFYNPLLRPAYYSLLFRYTLF
ncbi:MAG: hypothetical protein ABIW47_05520 [Ginsengibacter sp.]